jgi:hypothetical protein
MPLLLLGLILQPLCTVVTITWWLPLMLPSRKHIFQLQVQVLLMAP